MLDTLRAILPDLLVKGAMLFFGLAFFVGAWHDLTHGGRTGGYRGRRRW